MADAPLPSFCVCVPARNEAEYLPAFLHAMAQQIWPDPVKIFILINNSDDDSSSIIEAARHRYRHQLILYSEQVDFPPDQANAGSARRYAMDAGLALLGHDPQSLLISTDADAQPPPGWIGHINHAFQNGADMIGGRIHITDFDQFPLPFQRLWQAVAQYWADVRAIEDRLDPIRWDPPPRHGDHTGASLAISAALYQRCGGVPIKASGEDQALVLAGLAHGGKLVHPPEIYTYVSARQTGRAEGGMAAVMQDFFAQAEAGTQPMLPHFDHWRDRAIWRRALRSQSDGQAQIAALEPLLPSMPHDMMLMVPA